MTFWDDVHHAGALFKVSADSSATFFGALSGMGITGGGHVYAEDDVTPGSSAGLMEFAGDLTLGPLATLEIEIAGPLAGTEHDQVNVAGTAELDGELSAVLLGGWFPLPGDALTVLTCGGRSGEFATE